VNAEADDLPLPPGTCYRNRRNGSRLGRTSASVVWYVRILRSSCDTLTIPYQMMPLHRPQDSAHLGHSANGRSLQATRQSSRCPSSARMSAPSLRTARISHWRRTTSSRAGCCRQCYRTCRATPPAAPAASDAHGARAGQSLSYCVPRLCLYFSVLCCVIVCFFHLTLVFGKSVGQKSRTTSQTRSRLPRLSAVWQERAPCTIPHDSRTLYPLIHSRYEYDSVRIVGLSDADRVSARSPLLPR
jgi:hypothetical protein